MARPLSLAAWTVVALLLCLSYAPFQAAAHGYLQWPESRNYQAYTLQAAQTNFYCPQCGQGNGSPPGMCGDPFQGYPTSSFTPFTQRYFRSTTLTQGQTFTALITVTANHGGRMALAVCPLPKDQVTQDCFNRPENQLRRVNANPLYNTKRFWYLTAGSQFQETFKLPDGISCDGGCMMQWWWVGFQTCVMPCEDTTRDDVAGECGRNLVIAGSNVATCASPANTEQFYNCADVIIRSNGGTTPSTTPSTMPSTSPSTTPSTTPTTSLPPSTTQCPITNQAAFCTAAGVGLFPDPCSCSSFFNCGAGGTGGRQSCPSGLLFNKTTKNCDWPANVVC